MVEGKYIWCRNCNEVHHVTPFDRAPRYELGRGEQMELPMDDRRAFMRRHSGHRLEGLQGIGERYLPLGQAIDPMRVAYVEVTNGKESYILRSFRNRIEDPLHFELIRGRLKAAGASVSIQENEIRKEMRYHFAWRALEKPDDEEIELFIKLFAEMVRGLESHHIEMRGYESTASSAACGVLSPAAIERLMESFRRHFRPRTWSGLKRFVEAQHDEDGVMSLRVVRRYEIDRSVG